LLPAAVYGGPNDVVDIAPFGLLDVDANFTIRYLLDDQDRGSSTAEETFETRATWEEELFLMTRSFVYHPGFLNIDFGGGPVLVQQRFDSSQGDNRNNETLVNFLGRLNFLDLKTYPFSLYFQRSHPSVTTGLSGRFLTENNEYGFRGRLSGLLPLTSIGANFSHRDTEGSGFGSTVDDDIDLASATLITNYRGGDRFEVTHDRSRTDSNSGSAGLPIQQSQITVDDTVIRLANRFGKSRQFEVNQLFRNFSQETVSDTPSESENRNYNFNMRWAFSELTRSHLTYNFHDFKRTGSDSKLQGADWGLVHIASERFNYDVGADFTSEQQIGFDKDEIGARGAISYTRPTDFGSIGIAGSLRKDRTDQTSEEETIQVFDEPVVLNGTVPTALRNDFVIVSSVVVSNSTQTQTYVEDLDYRLVTVGSTTSIQRLIDGNIADGELVLVDYRYETGGTAEYDSLNSNISFSIGFFDHFNAFARFNKRDTEVLSGQLTVPLNDLTSIDLGLGISYPMMVGWTFDGQIRHVDQEEEISPFVRDSVDLALVGNLPGSLRFRLTGNLIKVDIENSLEGVDQVSYGLGISGRIWRRVRFDVSSRYLRDTGGTQGRRRLEHGLNLNWIYRQARIDLRAKMSDETLGDTNRRYLQVTAQATRYF